MNPVAVTVIVIIGTIAVVEAVNLLIKFPVCEKTSGFTAVIILNPEDDIELIIENAIHKLRWTDDELVKKLILINNGLDESQSEICRKYCLENSLLEIALPNDLLKIIFSCEKIM